jgi:hypothetical protein
MKTCATCGKDYNGRGKFFCSIACRSQNPEARERMRLFATGRVQSAEQVAKRIRNTDQLAKERKRKTTTLERFGVDNPSRDSAVALKISTSNTGKKAPRTQEHQQKIVEAKKANGTSLHRNETKVKIAAGIRAHYQGPNPCSPIANRGRSKHVNGLLGDIWYRSSYEKAFLEYCQKNSIVVKSASNKNFRVPYVVEDTRHLFYPDFYLPEFDLVVEVKAGWQLYDNTTQAKIEAASFEYYFKIVDEEELADLDFFFENLRA